MKPCKVFDYKLIAFLAVEVARGLGALRLALLALGFGAAELAAVRCCLGFLLRARLALARFAQVHDLAHGRSLAEMLRLCQWPKLATHSCVTLSRKASMRSAMKAPSSSSAKWPVSRRWNSTSLRSRSEEHTSELPSLMRISYAVFCL